MELFFPRELVSLGEHYSCSLSVFKKSDNDTEWEDLLFHTRDIPTTMCLPYDGKDCIVQFWNQDTGHVVINTPTSDLWIMTVPKFVVIQSNLLYAHSQTNIGE